MLNNFNNGKTINNQSEMNFYDNLFNLFINDFESYGADLKKYTKKINLDNEIIYSTILKDKFDNNSIIVLLEGDLAKIVMKFSNGDETTNFNYNFEVKKGFDEKTKIYDINSLNMIKTQQYTLLHLELYNYEKELEKFKVKGSVELIIQQTVKNKIIENNFHIISENKIISYTQSPIHIDSEKLIETVEDFLETKNIDLVENFKFTVDKNLKIKMLDLIHQNRSYEIAQKNLEYMESNIKPIMCQLFPDNIMNTVFKIEDYTYKGNMFVNIKDPNISINFYYDSQMNSLSTSFRVKQNFDVYHLRDEEVFKHKYQFKPEDFINLDFSYYSFYYGELRYEVSDSDKTQSAFYYSYNQNDHVAEYNDLIRDIMIKYSINSTSLKNIAYPSGDIKERFELNILENDKDDLIDLQKPFIKLRKNFKIQENKINLKKQVKNVK